MMLRPFVFAGLLCGVGLAGILSARTLEVGPRKKYARIEEACAKARAGDVIKVYPQKDKQAYTQVAVYVAKPRLTFQGVAGKDGKRVALSGKGYDYSGRGRIPRAIFQFNPGADGCVLAGFELFGASNRSSNGAGVRINQANQVTIRNCEIHHNDMGIMSNGAMKTGMNQLIQSCIIHHNGNFKHAGYNHNLYLGGASVTLRFCEVYASLTGHNVKSRAHYNRIEFSYIHDSTNREFDLVDANVTAAPDSHAVLLGNVIVKDPKCAGNRAVIHFGQDGGREHDGTLYLIHNTFITPFISPVVELSAPKAKAYFSGNIIDSGGARQNNQVIAKARNGARLSRVSGSANWLSSGFTKVKLAGRNNLIARRGLHPPFKNLKQRDFHLRKRMTGITNAGLPQSRLSLPPVPGVPGSKKVTRFLNWQYRHPASRELRRIRDKKPDLGAYEYGK